MSLRFLGEVEVTHLNFRKLDPEKEDVLFVDIKLEGEESHRKAEEIVSSFLKPDATMFSFWYPDGRLMLGGMKSVETSFLLRGVSASIFLNGNPAGADFGDLETSRAKVAKVWLRPLNDHRLEFGFQVSFPLDPGAFGGDRAPELLERLNKRVTVSLVKLEQPTLPGLEEGRGPVADHVADPGRVVNLR